MIYPENFESKIGYDRVCSQVKALCVTQGAVGKLAEAAFSSDYDTVVRRLKETFEMRTVLMMENGLPEGSFVDLDDSLKKAGVMGMFLECSELMALRKGLAMVYGLVAFFRGKEEGQYPYLKARCEGVNGFPEIINHIDSIVDKFGKVKDNASSELFALRKSLREREGQISRRIQQIMGQAQASGVVESDAMISIREGRAVIPVVAANKKKLKGLIHDESATGKTVYIEPIEVVELNNELKALEYEERREIVRILTLFTEQLRPDLPEIRLSGDFLVTMDFIRAKARFALANDCTLPIVERESGIHLVRGRHTLLAQTLRREGKEIVPLDLTLTPEKHILVISGPNAGGKSVCLKTVGLLQYMMQKGLLISASENSEMGLFDHLFMDIGDEQSIDNDLSTYSSHLNNMKQMLRQANDRSLILIDEFGTGTEPIIGGAIAESLLEQFEARHCFGVITTHYSNLKYYASNAQGISNGAMTFDVQNIRPLFRLEMGKPGSSFAIEIARKIGLPEEIIRRASEKAGSDHINLERQLREVARDRHYWEQKRDRIRVAEKRVEELSEKYGTELETLRAERNRLIKEARTEAQQITAAANRQIENTIREIKESQAEKGTTLRVRREMEEFRQNLEHTEADNEAIDRKIEQLRQREQRRTERRAKQTTASRTEGVAPKSVLPSRIEVGVKVRIKGQEGVGEVMALQGKRATVGMGQILTTLALDRLEAISNTEYKREIRAERPAPSPVTNYSTVERRMQFSPDIDVRGMRVMEALQMVQDFVDEAIMLGYPDLRILHGKGTGALKEEIRNYLRIIDLVKQAKDEHEERGGAGITVVRLDL
ncbi:MAG: Smr/MutS family protein [Alistipes sp.]|nr:Smr/MutS family protein [Alistipes sp.]